MSSIHMQCLLGLQCKDFVMIAADQTCIQGIVIMRDDEDKIYRLSDRLVMGVIGDGGDSTQFSEYIAKNMQLYKIRNGYDLEPSAAASFTRRFNTESLRTRSPYQVNILMGGYDMTTGPELFFMDYLGSSMRVPYAAHSYGGCFSLSIMDRYYREDATENEAYDILEACVTEVQKRMCISLSKFQVTVVDKGGIRALPVIKK